MGSIAIPSGGGRSYKTASISFTVGGAGRGNQDFNKTVSLPDGTKAAFIVSVVGGDTYQDWQGLSRISASLSGKTLTISGRIYKYADNSYNNRQYTVKYAYY